MIARLALSVWLPLVAPALGPLEEQPGGGAPPARTLGDCLRSAARTSERVGRAREALEQARLERRRARSAILPQLRLENTYFRQDPVDLGTASGSAFSFADRRNEALLSVSQPVFHGFQEREGLRHAEQGLVAGEQGLREALRSLQGDVALAFFHVLQAEAQERTLKGALDVERERLREIEARAEVGLARRTDVLLVRAQLAEDEANLERARNNLLVGREQLAFLTGEDPGVELIDDVVVPEELREPDGAAIASGSGRSDLNQKQAQLRAAEAAARIARGARLPAVDLRADLVLDRHNYSAFAEATDWTAELALRLPLFTGGRLAAEVAQADSRVRQARLERDELARRIVLEVRSAWLTLQSDLGQRRTLETSVAAADESYRLAAEEYRGGLTDNLEVLAAQNLLLANRLSLERQRYQVKLDWILLRLALGEPGEALQ